MKLVTTSLIFLCLTCLINPDANAVPIPSADEAPIATGKNIMAAAVFNDAPGSSDLTLIIQLKVDGDIVLDEGHECTAIQPLENIPSDKDPTGWTKPDFDDSDWQEGEYGVGYADADDKTILGDGQHAAVYTRAEFEIKNASSIEELEIGVDYDDGFVIWINGVEVARESGTDIPELPEWDSWTDRGSGHSHEASKQKPPRYSFVKLDVKTIASPFAVDAKGKLAVTWGDIRTRY